MKSNKDIIWSLAVVSFVLGSSLLPSGSTALAAQKPISELPSAIAPIKAPFDMPQLARPSFPNVTFDIRDYGAVQCKWEDKKKRNRSRKSRWGTIRPTG